MTTKNFKLNTGQDIPALGLGKPPLSPPPTPFQTTHSLTLQKGTWQSAPGEVKAAVVHALKSGYRLIDCAYCYGNEEEVGQGLAEAFAAGVCKREDVFVVSKVWATYTSRCELGLDKSLKSLGLESVDLFLVVCFSFLFVPVWLWAWLT